MPIAFKCSHCGKYFDGVGTQVKYFHGEEFTVKLMVTRKPHGFVEDFCDNCIESIAKEILLQKEQKR